MMVVRDSVPNVGAIWCVDYLTDQEKTAARTEGIRLDYPVAVYGSQARARADAAVAEIERAMP